MGRSARVSGALLPATMIPEVEIITGTQIDWKIYLQKTNEKLGRSLTRNLDSKNLPVQTLASFIATLDSLKNESSDPINAVREAGGILEHLHFGFLINTTTASILEIIERTGLRTISKVIDKSKALAIASGTLLNWYIAIIHGCNANRSFECRVVFNKCLLLFERQGLGEVWGLFCKEQLKDKSFTLQSK